VNPDELALLEEERRFLLRSIDDLDREHAAGDVDDADYTAVRDGYVARAAAVLRQIEEGTAALPVRTPVRWGRIAAWTAGVVAVAVLSGWLVARYSGQRVAGQTMTGGLAVDEVSTKLAQARSLLGTDPGAAITLYQEVIALEPDNPEARTYTAWLLALSAGSVSPEAATLALDQATALFEEVTTDTPTYADAHCLYAVTAARWYIEPDLDLAQQQGEACLANNPPGEMRGMIEAFVGNLG
jgi:hypothetical protein